VVLSPTSSTADPSGTQTKSTIRTIITSQCLSIGFFGKVADFLHTISTGGCLWMHPPVEPRQACPPRGRGNLRSSLLTWMRPVSD